MFTNRYTVASTAAKGIALIGSDAIRPRLIRRGLDARVARLAIDSLERIVTEALAEIPTVETANGTVVAPTFGVDAVGGRA